MKVKSWRQFDYKTGLGENQKILSEQFVDFDEKVGKELAGIYRGAIKAISDTSNPDRLAQAAHSCRELMSVFKIKIFGEKGYTINNKDIESVLKGMDPSGNPPKEVIETLQESWPKLYRYFSKIAHHESKPRLVEFSKNFEELETTFLILTQPSIKTFREIDEFIQHTPALKKVNEVLKRLKNNVLANYFYEKVNITWLRQLEKAGVFKNPPNAITEGNIIRFPPWPQVQLLLKASKTRSNKVINIIMSCRLPTDPKQLNLYILENFVECALQMPSKLAKKILSLIPTKKWTQCLYYFFLPEKLGDLSEYLASKGEIESALQITKILFDVTINEPQKNNGVTGRYSIVWQDAKSYYAIWEFEHIIKNKTKALREKAPERLMEILSKRLAKAIFLRLKQHQKKGRNDSSYVWRPHISHSSHHSDSVKDIFIDTINNLIQAVGNKQPSKLTKIVETLRNHKYSVFKRIEIYTYSLFPDNFKREIEKTLSTRNILYNNGLQNEYLNLLEKTFSGLGSSMQNEILTLIDDGPKDRKKYKNYWRLKYLHRIKDYLPSAWNKKYNQYLLKYGEPHYDEWTTKTWMGPTSPLAVDDLEKILKEKKIVGIVNYLKNWKPPDETFGKPSPEGLGRNLEKLIKDYSQEFSKQALLFYDKEIRPVYIYHLFSGLRNAIKEKKTIDWPCVIELAKKALLSENLLCFESLKDEMEPDWDSVYASILRLIREGFFAASHILFDERNNIWEILEKLSSHKNPDLAYEQKYGGDNMDPATMSVNTIRGEAIHSVIDYARWCAKNLKRRILVKEVKKILEQHLNVKKDSSLAIRAVYGWRLPNLAYLDMEWLKHNTKKIFPDSKNMEKLWLAAFESYLANKVYEDVFRMLKEEYLKAIPYLHQREESKRKSFVDMRERLPQHLMIAYVYDITDDDIIDNFFKLAPLSVKADAMEFVGKEILKKDNLKGSKKPNLEKTRLFLEKRMKLGNKEELKMFGWWFVHSPFDKKYSIQTLYRILCQKTGGEIYPAHEVIEKLREYVEIEPMLVAKCLFLIIEGDKKGIRIYYKRKLLKEIISILLAQRNAKIKKDTQKIINKLAERGYLEFKDLL